MGRVGRRANRKDVIHAPIVEGLEKRGIVVFDTSALGNGFPDIVCYYGGRWIVLELKSDKKTRGYKRDLTPSQDRTQAKAPIPVAHSLAEALPWFGLKE